MSPRRVLVVAGGAELRELTSRALDASLDLDLTECESVVEVLRRLPNASWDVFVVASETADAPGLDLVRALSRHALHGHAPVLFVGPRASWEEAHAHGARRCLGAEDVEHSLGPVVADLLELSDGSVPADPDRRP